MEEKKKRKIIIRKKPRDPKKKLDRKKLLRILGIVLFLGVAGVLGAIYGAYRAVTRNLPSIDDLEHYRPGLITVVYADDGQEVKEFARQKRVEVPYEAIPEILKNAIIATEDPRYLKHHGVDFRGILRAFKENIKRLGGGRKLEGGSTITQQLTRELFLSLHQTMGRKLKEIYLALKIEKKYSKKKILEIFCNQFFFGHGVYGVEAASNLFFGKSVSDLSLEDAALIAGILRSPGNYSPYTAPDLMLRRRNHVLNRMEEEGYITKAQADEARQKPMVVLPLQRSDTDFGAYFIEEVRKYLEKNYGVDALYRGGLRVYTTFNPVLQKYAEDALLRQLRALDKQKGWRRDKKNLLQDPKNGDKDLESYWDDGWRMADFQTGEVTNAVVLSVSRKEAEFRVKKYRGRLTNEKIQWTKTNNLENLIQRGDVIQVRVDKVDVEKKEILASLDQEPLSEAGFLAVDPHNGQIKAMVGGYSFRKSKFNRATQALRQSGSVIKPFLYTAALENGFSPASILVDEPTTFEDKWTGEAWTPPNYDGKYKGSVTLRKGLEESRNVVTARLLDAISPQTGAEACRRFGISSTVYPYISLSLGTFEVTLQELVSAYSVFPNKGVRIKPYFISRIEDKDGNVLEEAKVSSENVVSPQIAYLTTSLLQGVIERGTGVAAGALLKDKALAGKTGTTDDFTDGWFIGFSPSLCAGAWVGNDAKITLGKGMEGSLAALPIWIEFFSRIIAEEKTKAKEAGLEPVLESFEVPPNLSFVEIDRKTGLLMSNICLWPFREVFLPGSEPLRYCTRQDHMMILDYYGEEKGSHERR